jgi:hypothetical protein
MAVKIKVIEIYKEWEIRRETHLVEFSETGKVRTVTKYSVHHFSTPIYGPFPTIDYCKKIIDEFIDDAIAIERWN